jgi:hypothetical protein
MLSLKRVAVLTVALLAFNAWIAWRLLTAD